MQPLKTAVSPSSLSTMGWEPQVERSMTESRRWPNATRPLLQDPWPSGPRGTRASTIRATAVVSARDPSNVISPQSPHMRIDLTRVRDPPRREDGASWRTSRLQRRASSAFAACLPKRNSLRTTSVTRPSVPITIVCRFTGADAIERLTPYAAHTAPSASDSRGKSNPFSSAKRSCAATDRG